MTRNFYTSDCNKQTNLISTDSALSHSLNNNGFVTKNNLPLYNTQVHKSNSIKLAERKCKYTELKCLRPLCTDEVFLVLSRGIIFSQFENYIYCHVTLKIPKSVKVFDPSFLTFTLAFNPNGSFTFERYLYTEVKKLNVFGNNFSPMGKVLENSL